MSELARGGLPLASDQGGGRFPGFSAMDQAKHWDGVTEAVVAERLGRPADIRFFSAAEGAAASALCDQLLHQRGEPRVPVLNMIDARLADAQTDGWHYAGMPEDGQAWRDSLAGLDADARQRTGRVFAEVSWEGQSAILRAVQELGSKAWHGTPAARIWGLWTRYACTAFYSHPWAWDEIGFSGPAYPRGYKNIGMDRREPFEVADARPKQDPLRRNPS